MSRRFQFRAGMIQDKSPRRRKRSRTVSTIFFLLLACAVSVGTLPVLLQRPGGTCGMPIAAGLGTAFLLTCVAVAVVFFDWLMRSLWNRFMDLIDDATATTAAGLLESKDQT